MKITPYIADMLSQPEVLRVALARYSTQNLAETSHRLQRGEFDRILLTGMGASCSGLYPAWLRLAQMSLPVAVYETSELLHYAMSQVSPSTLLWVISQSGRSAEILNLLDKLQSRRPAQTIGVTNELQSPVGQMTDTVLPIYSGEEYTVSTRSYLNTLSVMLLAAEQLTGGDIQAALTALQQTADGVEAYLGKWQNHVEALKSKISLPGKMLLLGRGPSMAAVNTGTLILKEASKVVVEPMSSALFRHGPLELADASLTVLVYAGTQKTMHLNRSIALDVLRYGGHVFWIAPEDDPEIPTLRIPSVPEIGLPLAEILPIQMLSIAFAEQQGIEPGKFRHIGKVTVTE